MQPGLIIVSNRLPVSVKKTEGMLEFSPSNGGLATGLDSYMADGKSKWIGWPGIASDGLTEAEREEITEELSRHNCYPVFLTQQQIDEYYTGYSNSVLWPVLHDNPIGEAAGEGAVRFWKAYQKVNALFAEVVLALSPEDSRIWVHDYLLMLLPAILRKERPNGKIGFFLHTPFPTVNKFSKIREAAALLTGMLGADLVGLQTESYLTDFLDTVQTLDIGITAHHKVILENRVVRVTSFPISIDYSKYEKARKSRAVNRHYAELKIAYARQKVILMVDRLDPAKNLVGRLDAYRTLLRKNPQLHGKVVMIALVMPSRESVTEYRRLKHDIDHIIHDTNSEFGLLPWQPIDYIYDNLPFEQVTALYRRADVAFIAPKRDGMNLVAKEYVASRPDGALVLSKTIGAAQELKQAVLVDPLRPATLVKGLTKALTMPPKELKRRTKQMQQQLSSHTVQAWAGKFMRTLGHSDTLTSVRIPTLGSKAQQDIVTAYQSAKTRLFLLDYDGCLAGFYPKPEDAIPTPRTYKILKALRAKKGLETTIISGRTAANLQDWFGKLPINLIAEHGVFTRLAGQEWSETKSRVVKNWQEQLLPTLERYAARAPGAFVERKSTTLVWHYRLAKPYDAQKNLVILKRILARRTKSMGLHMRQGHMILEIKPDDINKGTSAIAMLRKFKPDFVLIIGDDYTDEDMFKAAPPNAHTIKVGPGRSAARFRLKNVDTVLEFLEKLSKS